MFRQETLLPRISREGGISQEGSMLSQEELNTRMEALKNEMKEHEGELVLMVFSDWEETRRHKPPRLYDFTRRYHVGMIPPNPPYYLRIGESRIAGRVVPFFPSFFVIGSQKHITFDWGRSREVKKEEGPVFDQQSSVWDLDEELRFPRDGVYWYSSNNLHPKSLEIMVGDKKVISWVEKEIVDNADNGGEHHLFLVFRKIFESLGKNLVLSEELTEKTEKQLWEARNKVLDSLIGLVYQGKREWWVQDEIKSTLERALWLEMHKEDGSGYRELWKEVLDVPTFICELCQKYGISISGQEEGQKDV